MEIKLRLGNWQQSFFFNTDSTTKDYTFSMYCNKKSSHEYLSKSVVYLGHLSGGTVVVVVLRPPRIVV